MTPHCIVLVDIYLIYPLTKFKSNMMNSFREIKINPSTQHLNAGVHADAWASAIVLWDQGPAELKKERSASVCLLWRCRLPCLCLMHDILLWQHKGTAAPSRYNLRYASLRTYPHLVNIYQFYCISIQGITSHHIMPIQTHVLSTASHSCTVILLLRINAQTIVIIRRGSNHTHTHAHTQRYRPIYRGFI